MILGHQFLQGNGHQWGKRPLFETHHDARSSFSLIASLTGFFVNLNLSSFPIPFLFCCIFSIFTMWHYPRPRLLLPVSPSSVLPFSPGWAVCCTSQPTPAAAC